MGPPSLASPAVKNAATPLSTLTPSANSLTVNLVLSDSLLNLYRDINYNSCTMCVCCTNDGNIRGGESLLYLPDINSDEDYDCKCGYSAVINRLVRPPPQGCLFSLKSIPPALFKNNFFLLQVGHVCAEAPTFFRGVFTIFGRI